MSNVTEQNLLHFFLHAFRTRIIQSDPQTAPWYLNHIDEDDAPEIQECPLVTMAKAQAMGALRKGNH